MSEGIPNGDESVVDACIGQEEEVDSTPRKTQSTGARLWERVRSRLIRPKVKRHGSSLERMLQLISAYLTSMIYLLSDQ